jgi:hypothetical protein
MTDTLTQLIAKLQPLLLDTGILFTTTTCTSAIRQALKHFNSVAPQHAGDLVTPVLGQKEYELDVPTALEIVDVLRQGKDVYAEDHISLSFDRYFEDGRPFFRLHVTEPVTNTLIVRYTLPHTISGLDGSTDSTLSAYFDTILLDGAAWQACMIRAVGRIESINMNPNIPDPWEKAALQFKSAFETGLILASRQQFARVLDSRIWHDSWEGQF